MNKILKTILTIIMTGTKTILKPTKGNSKQKAQPVVMIQVPI
jgi:hypothetical protein